VTRDDAITLTEWLTNAWPRPEWAPGQIAAFVESLLPYDAEIATQALAKAHIAVTYRPQFAEFYTFYRAEQNARYAEESATRVAAETPAKPGKLPLWVRRWIAARYLHKRFGRDQDMRRFPEQQEWADHRVPLMPGDEWVAEATAIDDRQAIRALLGANVVSEA
jgi:hypothetical protein